MVPIHATTETRPTARDARALAEALSPSRRNDRPPKRGLSDARLPGSRSEPWRWSSPGGIRDTTYGFSFTSSAPARSRGSIASGICASPSVSAPNPASPTPPPATATITASAARSASAAGNASVRPNLEGAVRRLGPFAVTAAP